MEMKNENAFTLIELLAVIVILAIIAVIATPLAINVINDSREKSFINSVYGLIDGVRLLSAEQVFEEQAIDVVVNFTDGAADNTNFKVSGDMPNSGTIHLNSDGKVELKVWSEELGKCAEKSVDEAEVKFTTTTKAECKIKIPKSIRSFTDVMEEQIETGQVMRDTTPDQNLRYVGKDPDNYVWFNKELWRIIGVFDGQVKIIRNEYYNDGNGIAFDKSSADGGNGQFGYSDWAQATLQKELNGTFLNNIKVSDSISYSYIDLEYVWNIGAVEFDNKFNRSDFYNSERSDTKTSIMINHIWEGAIGLMYLSDYGYASSGDVTLCDSGSLYNWGIGTVIKTECRDNSWLHDVNNHQWVLSSRSDTSFVVFSLTMSGVVSSDSAYKTNKVVSPVLYLKPNIKIIGGKGTENEPYELGV